MALVARYLDAVKQYLPASSQADVIAELTDSIQSQVEEKEAELGRQLLLEEESALIKPYGHPMIAASRYRSHQQLIGPALFPFYVNSLKVTLAIALGAVGVVALMFWAAAGNNAMAAFGRFWGAMWVTFFVVVGMVTAIFAAAERLQPREDYATTWDPRSLPPVSAQRVPLSCSITELVFNLMFAAFFLNLPGIGRLFRSGVIGPVVAIPFTFGGWWELLISTLILISLVHAMMNAINIARPDWSRLRAAILTVTQSFQLIVAFYILRQHDFVRVAGTVMHPAQYAAKAHALNVVVLVSLVCLALVSALTVASNVRKLVRRSKDLPSYQQIAGAE